MGQRTPRRPAAHAVATTGGALVGATPPGAARALLWTLALLLIARAVAPVLPGRAWWGIDLGRDLPPAGFWLPWALCMLALVPALAAPLVARLPEGNAARAALMAAVALGLGVLVWNLPERTFFTGDTALRHGSFALLEHPERVVPQALPADLWLHWSLPRFFAQRAGVDPGMFNRLWDAALVVVNAWVAWGLARASARGPAARFAAVAVAVFTTQLVVCNGYAKAIVEVGVLTLVIAGALVSIGGGGRGVARLGLAVGGALVLHRSAFLLLPAWLVGILLSWRFDRAAWRRPATWLGALAPLAGLAITGPRALRTLTTFDAAEHVQGGAPDAVRWLTAALAPLHLMDVLQLLLLAAPLALVVPVLLVARRGAWRRPQAVALAALVLPLLALPLLVRPQQGVFRDWDDFGPTVVAISAFAAWLVAGVLDEAPRAAWLVLPVSLTAGVPIVQWLAHQSDPERALARATSLLDGPPVRAYDERGTGFDQIAMTWFGLGRHDRADAVFRRAVEATPNPRVFVEWGMNATLQGRPAEALAHYLRAVELNPGSATGWKGVAAASSALGDLAHMALAVRSLERLAPEDPVTKDARAYLERNRPAGR